MLAETRLNDPEKAAAAPAGLRFHWQLPPGGEAPGAAAAPPDFASQLAFCRLAERCGIDSLLAGCGSGLPDPFPLVAALSQRTETVRFLVACRPGLLSPTALVQQVNTLSAVSGGRLSLVLVTDPPPPEQRAYGDFVPPGERFRRADEFLAICRAFWRREGEEGEEGEVSEVSFAGEHFRIEAGRLNTPFVSPDRRAPEIYLDDGSPEGRELAVRHADCWLRPGGAPEAMADEVAALRGRGIEVGVRLPVAIGSAETGDPAAAFALAGTPEEIAEALFAYRRIGVTQFLLSGRPGPAALRAFGEAVLPLVRARERAAA